VPARIQESPTITSYGLRLIVSQVMEQVMGSLFRRGYRRRFDHVERRLPRAIAVGLDICERGARVAGGHDAPRVVAWA